MKQYLVATMFVLLVAAGCSSSDEGDVDAGSGDDQTTADGDAGSSNDDGSADGSTSNDTGGDNGSNDDDAAEIIGNEDLDIEDLPEDVANALDDIDDVVSIGDCRSDTVGLAITAPDGWQCRVLDQPVGGLDGFTLFTDGNQLNITIGTPSPFGSPCEALQACDSATPIALGGEFPDTMSISLAGAVLIWGTHKSVEAELVVTNTSALTDEQVSFITMVLDSTVEI